ncbi:MAG TPA: hypothetical protein VH092_12925 [Urbifossiella sp.]|nr:hypothetical protein [Urbifossiella sp.]
MPKTTAELTEIVERLNESLAITRAQVADLEAGHQKQTDQLQVEREDGIRGRQELQEVRKQLDEERATGKARDEVVIKLREENAALRSRIDENAKQTDALTNRVWWLVGVLLVAALGFIGYSLRK